MEELESLLRRFADDEYVGSLNVRISDGDHEALVGSLRNFGNRVMFCTGRSAMRRTGFLDLYLRLFEKYGFDIIHYDAISPNPVLGEMLNGVDLARKFEPDFIFAMGGGSVIDTAKIISVGVYGDVWDFVEKRAEIAQAIPVLALTTTSGTGSQVTSYAVVTNEDTHEKKTLKHPLLLPKLSAVDIGITRFAPKYVVACTGFDVLCHAAEVYTRDDCDDAAAAFAELALRKVRDHLLPAYRNGLSEDFKGMAVADFSAGIALALKGTHLQHAVSHPISGRFPYINHGQSLALVFPECSRVQVEKGSPELKGKFSYVSELLGGDGDFVRTVSGYISALDLDRKYDFSRDDVQNIIKDTLGYRKSSVDRSPAPLTEKEVEDIIRKALL